MKYELSKMAIRKLPPLENIASAVDHIDHSVKTQSISLSAALGLIYSITETLGVLIGDPDLPSHIHSGYEGLAEIALELQTRIEHLQDK
jgi:hypothetical protein